MKITTCIQDVKNKLILRHEHKVDRINHSASYQQETSSPSINLPILKKKNVRKSKEIGLTSLVVAISLIIFNSVAASPAGSNTFELKNIATSPTPQTVLVSSLAIITPIVRDNFDATTVEELAVIRAAAAEAARIAAIEAARGASAAKSTYSNSNQGSSPQTNTSSGAGYIKNVWASGFQSELNACRGGVSLTANYGPTTVGEHWSCGGKNFPTSPGSIVTFTGVYSGVYQIIGVVAVLSESVNDTGDIPRGYDMLYQTCRNGNTSTMTFTALTKIG